MRPVPIKPAPGQESVWDYPRPPRLERTQKPILIVFNGVEIANTHRIPTFSQAGAKEVEYGFLLSISRPGFKSVGLFLAATIAKVLNGAKPRQLKQLFEETQNIAINLKTAELVGLYLYADILAAADEIYRDIIVPE